MSKAALVMDSDSQAISVRNLVKTYRVEQRREGRLGWLHSFISPEYRHIRALDGISFSVPPGEVVGLLGPNGAGKSTTVKIVAGIMYPDGGEVRVLGRDPHRQRIQNAREIGVLFGQRSHLIFELPAMDSFQFLRAVYRIPRSDFQRRLDELADVLELGPLLGQPVRTLSMGQGTRCDVAAAFLHRPKVVFLDEPTVGLDVEAKQSIRRFIAKMRDEHGVAVILTTHDLADIEELCERVILIDKGSVVYDGNLRRLSDRFAASKAVQVEAPTALQEAIKQTVRARWPDAAVEQFGSLVRVSGLADAGGATEVARVLLNLAEVSNLTITEPRVEEVIRNVFREGGVDGPDA